MSIIFHESSKTFHLYNNDISYIMCVLPNGHLGNLYFGKRIHDREDFSYLLEMKQRPMTACVYEGNRKFSLEHLKLEYPVYGSSDYRYPAMEILQENGSRISDFTYVSYTIAAGKPKLQGLPATYTEKDEEAQTLCVKLKDEVTGIVLELLYTIFTQRGIITRSARFTNEGTSSVHLLNAMSLSLDLPDKDYVWMQFSGAWSRERHVKERRLEQGIQSVGSIRGNSSHEHNPFIVLRRPSATENAGEVMGFSLIYSGNHRMQAEVDTHDTTRITVGINPQNFDWKLDCGESFQTPEAVVVFSDKGLNGMSQTFHKLYQKRLARGYWRDRPRPILNNNWEATYFDFTEDRLVEIAAKAKECGVELFVLDDGWFGARSNDYAGLGDWAANRERLPQGIKGIADRIEEMGMKFGLWFEPEMVNKDSDLYRAHPDWAIQIPGRQPNRSRYQLILDMGREDVRDYLYERMTAILDSANIEYVKWDMNRHISDVYSAVLPKERQGEASHRYMLGLYDLLERLVSRYPDLLLEGCSGGGGRFDLGMLYYSPQIWCSDDTDAVERLSVQYGTSFCYPISAVGSHVSAVPNHQTGRITPVETRGTVAMAGSFGYELDLNLLSDGEKEEVKEQIKTFKKYYNLTHEGEYYRLTNPMENRLYAAWEFVSQDQSEALVHGMQILAQPSGPSIHIPVRGLKADAMYEVNGELVRSGRALMHGGLNFPRQTGDFKAVEFYLKEVK